MTFSGYQVSGSIWENEICFAGLCSISLQYEATSILQDNWFLNSSAAGSYGIIGVGPNSPIWQTYSDTQKAVYSIGLARTSETTLGRLQQSSASNNLTFGYANDVDYLS